MRCRRAASRRLFSTRRSMANEARARLRGLYNGEYPAALRRAGAAHARVVHREGERVERRADRDRRSALHQRMGPRFSAGISRARQAARALSRRPDHGADRDRDRARARGHRQAAQAARPAMLRRQLQPAESDLPRRRRRRRPTISCSTSCATRPDDSGIVYCASRKTADSRRRRS